MIEILNDLGPTIAVTFLNNDPTFLINLKRNEDCKAQLGMFHNFYMPQTLHSDNGIYEDEKHYERCNEKYEQYRLWEPNW